MVMREVTLGSGAAEHRHREARTRHLALGLDKTIARYGFAGAVSDVVPVRDDLLASIVAGPGMVAWGERDVCGGEVAGTGAQDRARWRLVAHQREQTGAHQRRVEDTQALLGKHAFGHLRRGARRKAVHADVVLLALDRQRLHQ